MFDWEIKNLKSLNTHLQKLVEGKLWLKVLIALVSGVGVGILLSPEVGWITESTSKVIGNWAALPGNLFLKLVQMIMIPLIFVSIIRGIVSNNLAELRRMGAGVGFYFIATTAISIIIGIVVATFFQPGKLLKQTPVGDSLVEQTNVANNGIPAFEQWPTTISNLLPENPLASMVTGEMLSIVIFTIIIGIAITSLPKQSIKPIITLISAVQEISMTIIKWAMKLVPWAAFGLMVQLSSGMGLKSLSGMGFYILVVIIGLMVLMIVYALIVWLLGRVNPLFFFRQIRDVQLLAFSTTSSAAVMPLSLKTAEDKLKISSAVSNLIIPVGVTINMDGTAIFQCITTLFIAQAYGIEMEFMNLVLLMITIVAASIGTPAIPGGGVIVLASVLQSVGIPAEGIMLIIGVERILGMFRSAVNVTGDLVAATIFDRWYGKGKEAITVQEGTSIENTIN